MKVAGVPVAELRRRFAGGGSPVTPALLEALEADGRAGARALAAALRRRSERTARARRHLSGLFRLERRLRSRGAAVIAGVDEAGMGPLAGPVVAAAVVLPDRVELPGLDDSKRVPPPARERLHARIREVARAIGIGWATPQEVDRLNVYHAGLLAMRRAVLELGLRPDCLLVDARTVPDVEFAQRSVTHGDCRIGSIAAASVVAKVYRDAWMRDLGRRHPGYGFDRNAGYATAEHLDALAARGPSPAHRYSFAPVREAAARRRAVAAGRR